MATISNQHYKEFLQKENSVYNQSRFYNFIQVQTATIYSL